MVSLTDRKPEEVNRIRSISEVIEAAPLFDDQYIDFLHWLAFTTCSSLADVIAASLPSFLAPRLKRKVRLTEEGKKQSRLSSYKIFNVLAQKGQKDTPLSTLKHSYLKMTGSNQKEFYKELNFLKRENLLEVVTDSGNAPKTKTVCIVSAGENQPDSQRQKEILEVINREGGSMTLAELLKEAKTTRNTIRKMHTEGSVGMQDEEVIRDPLPGMTLDKKQIKAKDIELTEAQKASLEVLERELAKTFDDSLENVDEVKPWLLHGVTGSGKTEVYLRLIEKALSFKRSALLLVPEISLTPQLASLLVDRFEDKVAVWHSAISPGERLDTWKRLKAGSIKVLLGARSAVLANINDLGLIILDEEHDASYKQTSPAPRYNARDVALERAKRLGALIVLGSATPDLVTYHQAKLNNRILSLPQRVHKQELPKVEIVDMRAELTAGNRSLFSKALADQIGERLEKKEQIILLMNRRGYANHVFCRACGYVAKCKNCSVSLTFHRFNQQNAPRDIKKDISARGYLSCHHCGINKSLTANCTECQSPFLKEYGLGTQKVEESIEKFFPSARVVRLDSDVTAKKGEFKRVLDAFNKGDADILIGTQMVAKGLDVPNVTLVGVLAADASLNMPDYRSSERGFQLLAQVAGRAGRGHSPGNVIFQTYNPELELFTWARSHDYESFSRQEITNRKEFQYPPFSRLLRVIVSATEPELVEEECRDLTEEIGQFQRESSENIQILGPAPCIIERLRGAYRYHILIKLTGEDDLMVDLLGFFRLRKNKNNVRVVVDVDALDLL